jgi:hypothetical protein
MPIVKIICKKCGEVKRVEYRTELGHALTDEALAVLRAIEGHKCNSSVQHYCKEGELCHRI